MDRYLLVPSFRPRSDGIAYSVVPTSVRDFSGELGPTDFVDG